MALFLDRNLGDGGASVLATQLKENTTVTDVDVGRGYIYSNGARDLAEMLKTNTTITHLSLNGETKNNFHILKLIFFHFLKTTRLAMLVLNSLRRLLDQIILF